MSERPTKKGTGAISSFTGSYAFLSNFYSCQVFFMGLEFPTAEHAFQAAKTQDMKERYRIANTPSPAMAKRMGRTVTLRDNWDYVKLTVMGEVVRIKFSNPVLRAKLLGTHPKKLVEGNYWGDDYWGMVLTGSRWQGENHLGRILMQVRSELRQHESQG